MTGVLGLWDGLTDRFADGWDSYARALAYVDYWLHPDPPDEPGQYPWAIEQDTESNGSRIAIHDTSMFETAYNNNTDIIPDRNFKFVYNLCTVFPVN